MIIAGPDSHPAAAPHDGVPPGTPSSAPSNTPSAVPPAAPRIVPPAAPTVVEPDPGQPDGGENTAPLAAVGDWTEVPDEEPADEVLPLLRRLRDAELIGGGPEGFINAFADPRPSTLKGHHAYIGSHPWKPEDRYRAAAFMVGYHAATTPVKVAGKTGQHAGEFVISAGQYIGEFLIWAGLRIDMIGDRVIRVIVTATALGLIAAFLSIVFSAIH